MIHYRSKCIFLSTAFCMLASSLIGQIYFSSTHFSDFTHGVYRYDLETGEKDLIIHADITHVGNFVVDNETNQLRTGQAIYDRSGLVLAKGSFSTDYTDSGINYGIDYRGVITESRDSLYGSDEPFVDIVVEPGGQYLYATDLRKIIRYNLQTDEVTDLFAPTSGLSDIRSLSLDSQSGVIYFTQTFLGTIERINTDGTGWQEVVNGAARPRKVAHNAINDMLVWLESDSMAIHYIYNGVRSVKPIMFQPGHVDIANDGSIYWSNSAGQQIFEYSPIEDIDRSVIALISGWDFSIAVDPINGKMAVAQGVNVIFGNSDGTFMRAVNREEPFDYGYADVALDPINRRIYHRSINEFYQFNCRSTSYDSNEDFFEFGENEGPISYFVDLEEEVLYFEEFSGRGLFKSALDGQDVVKVVDIAQSYAINSLDGMTYYCDGQLIYAADRNWENPTPILAANARRMAYDTEAGRLYFQEGGTLKYTDDQGVTETVVELDSDDAIGTFNIENSNSLVPLSLDRFGAVANAQGVTLDWEVPSSFDGRSYRMNTGSFEINRQLDNADWHVIGEVPYEQGQVSYSFLDANPASSDLKYRIDYQSDSTTYELYSRVVTLLTTNVSELEESKEGVAYYNQNEEIVIDNFNGECFVADLGGRLVVPKFFISNSYRVSTDNLTTGVYIVMLKSSTGEVSTHKLMIHR